MSDNVVNFPNQNAAEEEAAAWLVKLDGDSAPSAEELEALHEWLNRGPENQAQLSSLAAYWGKLNVLTELAVPLLHSQSQETGRADRRASGTPRRFARAGLIAAALVVGLGIAFFYTSQPDPIVNSNGLYATTVGQQQSTTLADSSVVLLNTDTQIRVAFDEHYRNIYFLQGEAHFTVAKDAERPFRVYVGDRMVQAVGTAFSVYLKDTAVDVTVTEGQVALATVIQSGDGEVPMQVQTADAGQPGAIATVYSPVVEQFGMIRAGQSATIRETKGADVSGAINTVEAVEPQDMARRLSWREGMLTFNGDALEVVVDEISRYTTVSIEFSDPDVKATRIGGQFPIGETDAMFDALEANFQLKVTRLSDDRVLVSAIEQ